LPTKLEMYYIFAIQLLIYIIYGDRTTIGFVVNLINRPTGSAYEKNYFLSAFENVKLSFKGA
jgi:hypothetical protein